MDTPRNIYLVGPMGVGKTTVGKGLARALDREFIDCDRELEQRTGARVTLIFDVEGESGFRRRESALLEELTGRSEVVLATGGGVVLAETNRQALVSRGFVVYLHAPASLLIRRTQHDRARPLLQTDDRGAQIEKLLSERDPLYRQVADMIVPTDERSPRHVVREILRRLDAL